MLFCDRCGVYVDGRESRVRKIFTYDYGFPLCADGDAMLCERCGMVIGDVSWDNKDVSKLFELYEQESRKDDAT